MKKKGAAYGLLEGQMYPFACCSCMNLSKVFCLSCVSWYTFPGIEDDAPGFSSIVWSQMRGSGNLWEASSLNTKRRWWYLAGIFPSPFCNPACSASLEANVCFFVDKAGRDIRATCIGLVIGGIHWDALLLPAGMIVHWAICDSMALLVCKMSGNWSLLIHPHAQSIFGWLAANHGYPRMAF